MFKLSDLVQLYKDRLVQLKVISPSECSSLPVYLGILMHTKTRKRALVESLYELGLSVSYDRVLEISTDVGTKICEFYDRLKTVCPHSLSRVHSCPVPRLSQPVVTECPLMTPALQLEYRCAYITVYYCPFVGGYSMYI